MIIPFLSGCVSDDCSDCVDMAYDTRVKLKIIWPSNLSTTKSAESPELDIHDFTLFVFNEDGSLNTIKKVNSPTFSTTIPYSSSVTMNVTSTAKTIYVIANCSDLLSNSPTSSIATQVRDAMANPLITSLKNLFDSTLAVDYDKIIENGSLVHSGKGDIVSAGESNPYNYVSTINIKPIVSKFDIKVSSISSTPIDFIGSIHSISGFILNSRSNAKLFSSNANYSYIHGAYNILWMQYNPINFGFEDTPSIKDNLRADITYTPGNIPFSTNPISIYSPENDTIATLGSQHKTLVVLKIKYKMISMDGTEEYFDRFLTVSLNPSETSTLSNKRGTRYIIDFKLSGNYYGSLSPLSSLMQPYSPLPPLPFKTTKNLIYVEPDDYSKVKSSEWK